MRVHCIIAAELALVSLICSPAVGQQDQRSGNYWSQFCASDTDLCIAYLNGMTQLLERKDMPFFFCTPPGGVTIFQMRKVVAKYLQDNPERLHLPFIQLTLDALGMAFPCKT
jgi:hypothetical protein